MVCSYHNAQLIFPKINNCVNISQKYQKLNFSNIKKTKTLTKNKFVLSFRMKSNQNLVNQFVWSFPTLTEPLDQLYASNKQEKHLLQSKNWY